MTLCCNLKSPVVAGSSDHLQHLRSHQSNQNNIVLVQQLLGIKEITEAKAKPVTLSSGIHLTAAVPAEITLCLQICP